ncbi:MULTISPECIES: hypothetical protein [Halopseudomonas]|uniref:hypothetical protein n=1 Tax=Halopseudomonas TaxID=2901189 RepID=UPI001D185759|nr:MULTISPECIES: hypothetical protein [Halopseudomonas]MCC4260208.1 hypothetical protein [Halopseudomonas aestusnigri]
MSFIESLVLKFKGERAYLHGTDIYQALSSVAEKQGCGHVKRVVFRRAAIRQLDVVDQAPVDPAVVVAQADIGGFESCSASRKLWLIERDDEVSERYGYPEDQVVAGSVVSEQKKSITKHRNKEFLLIEEVVAMHKKLCNALFGSGNWLFSQLDVADRLVDGAEEILLVNKSCLSGRLVVSEVFLDQEKVATIRFVRS